MEFAKQIGRQFDSHHLHQKNNDHCLLWAVVIPFSYVVRICVRRRCVHDVRRDGRSWNLN
ncbi:hypothetical protein MASR2M70_16160 [Bacillota bacterium]